MELKIAVQELARALARSQGIVEKKSTMPILSHVLLDARKGDVLVVAATDLDVSVQAEHKAEVLREGAVAVSAKHLYEIVRALPEATVSLKKAANNWLEVRSGAAEFKIVGLPAEDFPATPKFEKLQPVAVKPDELLWMVDLTAFAASSDETRYNLNGVFFEPSAGQVRMVATDGHRLSLAEKTVEGNFGLKKGVILPRKGLAELKKLLLESQDAGDDALPKLGFAENAAIFQRPGLTLSMRLIEGVFPDYKQVIPRAGDRTVKLGRIRFLETLRRISLLSTDKAHAVRLELGDNALTVRSQNPELGEAKEELPVEYTGPAMKIGFNARYIMDILVALQADDVVFELTDDLSPGVIRPAAEVDQGFTAVVMPMRI